MTIIHHPNEETLLDYASGALGEAWSVAVATHLAVCPEVEKRYPKWRPSLARSSVSLER